VVVKKDEDPLVLDTPKLLQKFAPHGTRGEVLQLRAARLGSFLGLCKGSRTGRTVPFIIWNQDRSNKIKWVLKRDAAFPDRLLEIYRLEEIDWGTRFTEIESGEIDRLPGNNIQSRRMTEAAK
jgi:hypothetical protein